MSDRCQYIYRQGVYQGQQCTKYDCDGEFCYAHKVKIVDIPKEVRESNRCQYIYKRGILRDQQCSRHCFQGLSCDNHSVTFNSKEYQEWMKTKI